ncbi:MAG: 7-cyano-7-deazaguanine synthase QueC [Ktedonobacteraceae bacterium]
MLFRHFLMYGRFTYTLHQEARALIMTKKAIVLLSGGLDSATTLAIAQQQGFALHTLSFDYGQRHQREVEAAAKLVQHYHVERQQRVTIDLRAFGGSALTADIPVPHDRSVEAMSHDIPITYVPARNTVFLSFALAHAEVSGADDIFLGINAIDYSGYPDCRPEYLAAFEHMANLATKATIQDGRTFHIHAPLMHMDKAQIIRTGTELGVPYELTWSCYEGGEFACGTCDSCLLRLNGFAEAGRTDPIAYEPEVGK